MFLKKIKEMNTILLQSSTGNGPSQLLFFGLIFVVMYFFMIRPQIKKQKKERQFREELKKGDKIVTVGGIHGKIIELTGNTVTVDCNGTKLKVEKSAISTYVDSQIES